MESSAACVRGGTDAHGGFVGIGGSLRRARPAALWTTCIVCNQCRQWSWRHAAERKSAISSDGESEVDSGSSPDGGSTALSPKMQEQLTGVAAAASSSLRRGLSSLSDIADDAPLRGALGGAVVHAGSIGRQHMSSSESLGLRSFSSGSSSLQGALLGSAKEPAAGTPAAPAAGGPVRSSMEQSWPPATWRSKVEQSAAAGAGTGRSSGNFRGGEPAALLCAPASQFGLPRPVSAEDGLNEIYAAALGERFGAPTSELGDHDSGSPNSRGSVDFRHSISTASELALPSVSTDVLGSVRLKIDCEGSVRRLTVPLRTSYEKFVRLLESEYAGGRSVRISYVDEDSESISIMSQTDLDEALSSGSSIRILLCPIGEAVQDSKSLSGSQTALSMPKEDDVPATVRSLSPPGEHPYVLRQRARSAPECSSDGAEISSDPSQQPGQTGQAEGHRRVPSDSHRMRRAGSQQKSDAPMNVRRADLIGEGAFGKVFLGLNRATGKLVAIKHVALTNVNDKVKDEVRQLEDEMKLLQQLDHRNIVRYLGVKRVEGAVDIYLEYVPGGSISSLLEKFGAFDEDVIRNYTRQILNGLVYLHDHNIIHRDIKGANLLVDTKGVVKLADFNCSKQLSNIVTTHANNDASGLRGTPFWMAPEVVRQSRHSKEADIWSLGCTLLEMATGEHPWSNLSNQYTALFRIGASQALPPIPSHLSPVARDFIMQCLCRDYTKRLTARQLLRHPFITGTGQDAHARALLRTRSRHRRQRSRGKLPGSAEKDGYEEDSEHDSDDGTDDVADFDTPRHSIDGVEADAYASSRPAVSAERANAAPHGAVAANTAVDKLREALNCSECSESEFSDAILSFLRRQAEEREGHLQSHQLSSSSSLSPGSSLRREPSDTAPPAPRSDSAIQTSTNATVGTPQDPPGAAEKWNRQR